MAYRRGDRIVGFTPSFIPFRALFGIIFALVRIVDWLAFGLRVEGRARLCGSGPAILVSNHTLLLDPGLIAHAVRPRRTYFTMLEDTATIPFLGTFVRLLGGLPIPSSPGSLRALEAAARTALGALGFLHFFPEGELYLGSQEIRPFHPGAFLLACRLEVPVIPVTTVLRERRIRGLPPRVTVVIGEPVPPPRAQGPRRAALLMGRRVRALMQETIDSRGGSRTLYRGMMPRLVKRPAA
jgi:1-acyl-sn-glycerol-3-phosphate acyltransferase